MTFFGQAVYEKKPATGRWGAGTSHCAAATGGSFYIE